MSAFCHELRPFVERSGSISHEDPVLLSEAKGTTIRTRLVCFAFVQDTPTHCGFLSFIPHGPDILRESCTSIYFFVSEVVFVRTVALLEGLSCDTNIFLFGLAWRFNSGSIYHRARFALSSQGAILLATPAVAHLRFFFTEITFF